jgi:hypothetical protein
MDLDQILLFLSMTRCQQKTKISLKNFFSAYYFLKVHLHHFLKIKVKNSHKTVGIKVFSYYFGFMIERSGSGSRSIHLISGSGSGSESRRPKTYGSDGTGSATMVFNIQYTYIVPGPCQPLVHPPDHICYPPEPLVRHRYPGYCKYKFIKQIFWVVSCS